MRVTHLIKATGLAGAESHLVTLLPALASQGVECDLLVLAEPGRPPSAFLNAARSAGIKLEVIPIYADADPTLPFRLAGRLRQLKPDILHTHLIHADLHGAAAASLAHVSAVVISRHNDDRFRRLAGVRQLNQWAVGRAQRLIAISQAMAGFARQVEGALPDRVITIHYGLDPDAYLAGATRGKLRAEMGWGEETPIVLFVGRLTAQKGVEILLTAWPQVVARCPTAHLVIAGDGELRTKLANYQSLISNLSFLGWRSDVPSLMLDADIVVVPSLWEGFGLVTLEAMAARKPVVASRVSALPEIVAHGETGLLVPPGQPQPLAEALAQLLTDPARADALGQAGRRRLEAEFTVEQTARRHVEVYLSVCAASAAPSR